MGYWTFQLVQVFTIDGLSRARQYEVHLSEVDLPQSRLPLDCPSLKHFGSALWMLNWERVTLLGWVL